MVSELEVEVELDLEREEDVGDLPHEWREGGESITLRLGDWDLSKNGLQQWDRDLQPGTIKHQTDYTASLRLPFKI